MIKLVNVVRSSTDTAIEVISIYFVLLLAAAGLFSFFEHRTFQESFYWAYITATTVGYGDISPKTVGGHIVTFFLAHIALFIILPILITKMVSALHPDNNIWTHDEQEQIKGDITAIRAMLENQKHD